MCVHGLSPIVAQEPSLFESSTTGRPRFRAVTNRREHDFAKNGLFNLDGSESTWDRAAFGSVPRVAKRNRTRGLVLRASTTIQDRIKKSPFRDRLPLGDFLFRPFGPDPKRNFLMFLRLRRLLGSKLS